MRPCKRDVRLITATNRNLEQLVSTFRFRKDLYYRLNVFTISLPPLRERPGDVPLLVEHLLKRFRRELNKEVETVAGETMEMLARYTWPGNIRELQSVLKQALLHATGPVLIPDFLASVGAAPDRTIFGERFHSSGLGSFRQRAASEAGSEDLYAEALAAMERQVLTSVLRHTEGNQVQAARILTTSGAACATRSAR